MKGYFDMRWDSNPQGNIALWRCHGVVTKNEYIFRQA